MSDFEDIEGEIEKRQRKDLDKAAKFERKLGRLSDAEFAVIKGKLIAEAEAQPPKAYDGGPGSTRGDVRDDQQVFVTDEHGNRRTANDAELADYMRSIGIPTRLEGSLSEMMQRERERRAKEGLSNG